MHYSTRTVVGVGPVDIRARDVVDVDALLQREREREIAAKRLVRRVRRLIVAELNAGLQMP